jgi:hypothetical protein
MTKLCLFYFILSQKAMKEGVLKVQLIIPSIKADATLTAIMKRGEEMECELKSDIKFLESTSEQKLSLKYGKVFCTLK